MIQVTTSSSCIHELRKRHDPRTYLPVLADIDQLRLLVLCEGSGGYGRWCVSDRPARHRYQLSLHHALCPDCLLLQCRLAHLVEHRLLVAMRVVVVVVL